MTGWNFGWRLISETPSTLVVAPISFFCLCGQGADHTRNLALWNLPRAEVWAAAPRAACRYYQSGFDRCAESCASPLLAIRFFACWSQIVFLNGIAVNRAFRIRISDVSKRLRETRCS